MNRTHIVLQIGFSEQDDVSLENESYQEEYCMSVNTRTHTDTDSRITK